MPQRCSQTNKFASYEEGDPEISGETVTQNGEVSASIRIVLVCAECTEEMKSAEFDVSGEVEMPEGHYPSPDDEGQSDKRAEHEVEVEFDSPEMTSRSEGRAGAPARYMKTFYGFSVEATVKCSGCPGFEGTVTLADDVQASAMEELL